MKLRAVLLSVLCVLLILCIPCTVSYGALRTDVEIPEEEIESETGGEDLDFWGDDTADLPEDEDEEDLDEEDGDGETETEDDADEDPVSTLLNILIPSAYAEETVEEADPYALPIDIAVPGMEPNPDGYKYDYDENGNLQIKGYADDSIIMEIETVFKDGVSWRVAKVQIKSPTQLRTGIAGSKVSSSKTAVPTSLAKKYNAVIAMNGDDYQQQKDAKSFEYRMGQKVRSKSNTKRDILIIDEEGNLNIFVKSDAAKMKAFAQEGHKPINAFTFGPALVIDGEVQAIPKDYKYNPNANEPRSAIGQTGELSYVLVIAEGRNESGSRGVTVEELADYMKYELGCIQAYNLDGGNTAEMVVNNKMYMDKVKHNERDMYDIIYFATAVDPADWKKE